MKNITVLDSTLRDGMQGVKISFSVKDKIRISKELDRLGITYIEGGNPVSNRTDREFFGSGLQLENSKLAAFGSTCRAGMSPEEDENFMRLIKTNADTAVIFGKSSELHVKDVLCCSLEENLRMIGDSVLLARKAGKSVIFDAEHFFDGYKINPEYAVAALKAADEAGASVLCLCDTNGGCFPGEIYCIVKEMCRLFPDKIGIHTHNDSGMAVAGSVSAIEAGAVHLQGTLIGIGERCGNANLSAVIANLQLKTDKYDLIGDKLPLLTEVSRKIAEITNVSISNLPYVGKSAFSHKSGMHIDAVLKNPKTFEHVDPKLVGNSREFLLSEMAGKTAVMQIIKKIDNAVDKKSEKTAEILNFIKELEFEGYQFESATASLELFIMKKLGVYKPPFEVKKFRVISENADSDDNTASCIIKIDVNGKTEITAAESDGPIHAMDVAVRKALTVFFPELSSTHLVDYKVRVIDSTASTGSKVRVMIETNDGYDFWTTIGVSTDIITATKNALIDSYEYKLLSKRDE